MKACTTILFFAFLATSVASILGQPVPGGYVPIENVNDPQIQGIARFAVAEHNRKTGNSLVYVRVVWGERAVVAGSKYRLQILAKPAYQPYLLRMYEATVWEKSWEKYMELLSFEIKY